jgi:RimJ/RimL family protein N-acetyltransferase
MRKIVTGPHVCEWVCRQLEATGWLGQSAIGLEQDGEIIAGVLYEGFIPGLSICMHVAAKPGAYWVTKDFMRAVFRYPFEQLKCKRVNAFPDAANTKAVEFDKHMGFVQEGVMRCAARDGGDVLVMGMLREECRFLDPEWKKCAS